jgi:hypothetical protein
LWYVCWAISTIKSPQSNPFLFALSAHKHQTEKMFMWESVYVSIFYVFCQKNKNKLRIKANKRNERFSKEDQHSQGNKGNSPEIR